MVWQLFFFEFFFFHIILLRNSKITTKDIAATLFLVVTFEGGFHQLSQFLPPIKKNTFFPMNFNISEFERNQGRCVGFISFLDKNGILIFHTIYANIFIQNF